jgi:hypothetical protein
LAEKKLYAPIRSPANRMPLFSYRPLTSGLVVWGDTDLQQMRPSATML